VHPVNYIWAELFNSKEAQGKRKTNVHSTVSIMRGNIVRRSWSICRERPKEQESPITSQHTFAWILYWPCWIIDTILALLLMILWPNGYY
jgi:hypothetical protein